MEIIDCGVVYLQYVLENYYDDVVVWFGLDDVLFICLYDDGLFYDCDLYGDFLYVYIEFFCECFFFEFVQCNGYLGYGVVNVVVCMVVQV